MGSKVNAELMTMLGGQAVVWRRLPRRTKAIICIDERFSASEKPIAEGRPVELGGLLVRRHGLGSQVFSVFASHEISFRYGRGKSGGGTSPAEHSPCQRGAEIRLQRRAREKLRSDCWRTMCFFRAAEMSFKQVTGHTGSCQISRAVEGINRRIKTFLALRPVTVSLPACLSRPGAAP